jgi:hypothetical protein
MLTYMGHSASAWSFAAMNSYTGRENPTYPMPPQWTEGSIQSAIYSPLNLARMRGYHHRVYLPRYGGAIRDSLTNLSLEHSAPVTAETIAEGGRGMSHAQFLGAQVAASRGKYLEQGWKSLRSGDFARARSSFENASLIDRRELDPRVGKFLCSVADRQVRTAIADLDAILKLENMFAGQHALRDLLPEAMPEAVLAHQAGLCRGSPQWVEAGAVQVYLLWLDGQQAAAQAEAERLRNEFRGSTYAVMAERIREQLEKANQTQAAGPGAPEVDAPQNLPRTGAIADR